MAKSSKKTVWLILAVLLLVMTQLGVIGFVLARTFSPNVAAQAQPNQVQRGRQNFSQPIARKSSPRQPVRKIVADRPRPTGPRAELPQFSKAGGVYKDAFNVELSTKSKDATIRYTLDGSEPVESSPAYSGPISIKQSTLLRAACFAPGVVPSIAASEAYNLIDDDLENFSSNLPIIIINAFNQPLGYSEYVPMSARFIDVAGTRATMTGVADFDGWADVKRRGFTSLRFPKMSLTVKTRDDEGDKTKAPLFGLPSDSDWVLYAPYVDKTMMRDVLGYELSNQMGRYAPRTRFVEVFIHRGGAKVSYRDYAGVYVLVEKVKRGKERVNITKLGTNDDTEPAISGGYILKRDHGAMNRGNRGWGGDGPPRASDDGAGFITPRGLHLFYVEPNEDELTDAQKKWMTRYFTEFDRALYGSNFTNPTNGYAKYLDVDAFIDHFWLAEVTKNVDAFRYSAFLHKPRGGKIIMGPAWDWNLSFGNADYYDGYETSGWYYENLRDTEISWIYRLRQDPDFMQRSADRWAELRRDVLAPEKVLARVDAMRVQLQESQERNFRKWPVLGRTIKPNYYVGRTFDDEVNWMKLWIRDRIAWIDRQYPAVPKLSEKPGRVAPGTKVKLTG
ncbi:MAG TPA: CotH kinase family protein, partial [Methylomirabilota bacterium]|nr:CotH kinase family protein [Methylomirabilota bacterium]